MSLGESKSGAPQISVIMGVYKPKRKMLMRSVRSLVDQTFQDWELIICDDGSGDVETKLLLEDIEVLDDRVSVIGYEVNKGLAAALNECLAYARGVYIARHDDDDYSLPDRLQKQVDYLDANPTCSFVGSTAFVFDELGQWGQYNVVEDPSPGSFLWNSPFIHPSVMFRKEELKLDGGYRVAPETERVEDYDLFMSLYATGRRGHNIQDNLYAYRIDRQSKRYRPIATRINEAKVRSRGFKKLGLGIKSIPYIIKPVIIGLIPGFAMRVVRKSRY